MSLDHRRFTSPTETYAPTGTPGLRKELSNERTRIQAIEDLDVRIAGFWSGHDVGSTIAIEISASDRDANFESRISNEVTDRRTIQVAAAKDAHSWIDSGADAGDDVHLAVAIYIACADEHASRCGSRVGKEFRKQFASAPLNTRTCGPPPGPVAVMMSAVPSP